MNTPQLGQFVKERVKSLHHADVNEPLPRDKGGWRVAPAPDGRGAPEPPPARPPHRSAAFVWIVTAVLVLNLLSVFVAEPGVAPRIRVPFNPYFLNQVQSGQVTSIASKGDTIQGTFKSPVRYPADGKQAVPTKLFATEVPTFWNNNQLAGLLRAQGVQINATSTTSSPSLLGSLLLGFGPTLLLVGLFLLVSRRVTQKGGIGGLGTFGRSQARQIDPSTITVTFADVAGIDEAKSQLTEIVDFLRHPDHYTRLGGRMPHGVLLSGPPGTGKTLLARAVAGEAEAAFFSISASEFIEAIVGVGASRVRDLFAKAKEAAPAIVFIDEIDAVGRSRGGPSAFNGGNDEREQTLDQLLTEMDGFAPADAVVVLAATNRPDVLDRALLRPGRFDRRVSVQAPDRVGRQKILDVHTRSMSLAKDVDLAGLAASTPGMVGADLANLANEAALLGARRDHKTVEQRDFTDALETVLLGAPRGIVLSTTDRERTAYHESGHALVGMLTPEADPVRKVTIIPRGRALGVTLSAPDDDQVSYTVDALLARIKVAVAGRVAEEVVFGTVTTGAESDLDHATAIARQMVGRWGMSDAVGLVTVLPAEGQGPVLPGASEISSDTQRLIDEEVRRFIEDAHHDVTALLTDHRDQLDSLSTALLHAETLDEVDAYAAARVSSAHDDTMQAVASGGAV